MDVTGAGALSRLTSSDLDDVTRFLHATWRHQYGNESYPAFSRQYLEWLYGGPHEDDTVLLGVRDSGRLVGFKAMIFRPLLVKGHPRRSHVATHLAVDLALPLADRVAALGAVACPSGSSTTSSVPISTLATGKAESTRSSPSTTMARATTDPPHRWQRRRASDGRRSPSSMRSSALAASTST
jgi:hypothetical protein